MGWKQSELDRMAKIREENRKGNVAPPPTEQDRRDRERNRRHNAAVPGKQPDRKGAKQAAPGVQPDRTGVYEKRKYVVASKKCSHGKQGDVVELEANGPVLALVEAGVLRLYVVKTAIKAEDKEASDG